MEYLAVVARLAAALKDRDQHLWVFQSPSRPGEFLEFREARDPSAHSVAAPTPIEAELTRTLRELGSYGAGADDLWLEVSPTD